MSSLDVEGDRLLASMSGIAPEIRAPGWPASVSASPMSLNGPARAPASGRAATAHALAAAGGNSSEAGAVMVPTVVASSPADSNHHEPEHDHAKLSVFWSIWNLLNDVIAAGAVALPFLVASAGVMLAPLLMLLYCYLAYQSLMLMYELVRRFKVNSFPDLAQVGLGRAGVCTFSLEYQYCTSTRIFILPFEHCS